jgi:membrane-bound serine protease (ClpP class)
LLGLATGLCAAPAADAPATPPRPVGVVVIPVRNEIARPELYIIRRGLKEAIARKADVVVFDIKTPGGALDVTFAILEAMGRFPGKTVAFVNNEAMSAGAFVSAMADEIWFTPDGVIGAAAPVTALGQDVDKTMRLKITSYLKARMRAISEGKGYRGQVISAMIDPDTELKIGDKVLKEKGELLSLTATEAGAQFGTPPQPLLAAGVARDVEALLTKKFGAGAYSVRTLEVTWSERLAVFMNSLSPVLLGLGLLALFIEFKTPGFGVFGITGIALLVIVFLGNFVAGLSGHEPLLVFALGVILVVLELFFFPGVVVLALTGLLLMFGALVWSMADLWPNQPIAVAWSADAFLAPLRTLGLGLVIAAGLALALARVIPKGWFWQHLAVAEPGQGSAQVAGGAPAIAGELAVLVGRQGIAATALFPSGQVEVDGRRYEARLEVGFAPAGTPVQVKRATDFGLVVEAIT